MLLGNPVGRKERPIHLRFSAGNVPLGALLSRATKEHYRQIASDVVQARCDLSHEASLHRCRTELSANRLAKSTLNSSARERQAVGRVATRAHLILLSNRGHPAPEIADLHGVTHPMVYKWIGRFDEEGPSGLYDREREGRPPKVDEEAEE